MRIDIRFAVIAFMLLFNGAMAAEDNAVVVQATEAPRLSLQREAAAAFDRGAAWLAAMQNEDGSWSNKEFPALTALSLWALAKSDGGYHQEIDKAVQYILSCVQDDGSIWRKPSVERKGGGLANYNTALCMVALNAVNDPALVPVVQKARRFIAGTQHTGDDIYRGGMGYDGDTGRPYADLSNSYIAYEAMRLTQNVEDLRSREEGRADLDWQAAREFIQRVQNRKESNDQPWASDDPAQHGGFAYKPDSSQAGTVTNEAGEITLRSYGSMTYAGLLSFIYADVNKDDPRVESAFDWAVRHWTLDENPGMGAEGLFYFYNVLSKALAAYGQNEFTLADGQRVDWRTELSRKLVSLQRIDPKTGGGYWVNEVGRWWEADPVLVTAYSLLALDMTR